ncbi:MAG: ABC transporter substrate-binding protein [Anaerolineae bacterium]|nr:ABC transporter substrate-binding protein [Anaerolineae bacterium]
MTEKRYLCRGGRVLLVGLVVLALLVGGCDVKKPKVYRVGVLAGLSYVFDITKGFKEGMAELGYVEGENIVYDVQETDFDMAVYRSVLEKFVADEVDLILVFPTEASLEAKSITQGTGIPVVFSFAVIEETGLVESVREPGGNMTGVRYPAPDIAVKRFEIMRAIAPEARRMWIPYQRGYPIIDSQLAVLRPAAEAAGVTLIEFPADDAAELQAELDVRAKQADLGIDAILFLSEPIAVTPAPFLVMGKFAHAHKVPIGGAFMSVEGYDSLFGVVPGTLDSGKLAAPLADKVLKGTPAGTIPVVSPENFIQIDYKAAQAMGLTVPESLLAQADEIIR